MAEVTDFIATIEAEEKASFDLFIAHHTFLNPVVMRDINLARVAQGKKKVYLHMTIRAIRVTTFHSGRASPV